MTVQSLTQQLPKTRSRLVRPALAAFAAAALLFSGAVPANAATGPQTGEWDILATSQSQTPRLQSYNHDDEEWDTVLWWGSSAAWFAVGSGKFINGDEENGPETPVEGGGVRFETLPLKRLDSSSTCQMVPD